MANNDNKTDTTPTALQATTVASTRPKLIIGGACIIALIVILLEIYVPREKNIPPGVEIQTDSTTIPAAIKPSSDGVDNQRP